MFDFLAHLFYSLSAVFSSQFIVVDVRRQKLTFYRRGYSCVSFDVSTSAFGVGEVEGSFQTPRGWFKVCESFGEHMPLDTVFSGRVPRGIVSDYADEGEDLIIARILRLKGLQSKNRNTFKRYIYMHGTTLNSMRRREKTSLGCVRMYPEDIADLYAMVRQGILVYIVDQDKPLLMQPCFYDLAFQS